MMLWMWCALALASLQVDPPPRVNQASVITVLDDSGRPAAGVAVSAVIRPGLDGERQASLSLTDSLGHVEWVPDAGGEVSLHAGVDRLPVRVTWDRPPSGSVALLLALLLAAVGATTYGAHRARRPLTPPPRAR